MSVRKGFGDFKDNGFVLVFAFFVRYISILIFHLPDFIPETALVLPHSMFDVFRSEPLITCEVIETIQAHGKVTIASDHDGVEGNEKNAINMNKEIWRTI
jgi:hypothetical protein